MGLILEKTKIAENLINDMNSLLQNTESGLAISVVVVGSLMAASTGIVGASVVTLDFTIPSYDQKRYNNQIATGTIYASGTLGQIIPPSLVLILLADVLSASYQQSQLNDGIFNPESITIADLFAGAILPGLLLPVLYNLSEIT